MRRRVDGATLQAGNSRSKRAGTFPAGPLAACAAVCAIVLSLGSSGAHADEGEADLPDVGAYFGSILDWSSDTVADQSERLGAPSAMYQHEAGYPLTSADWDYLAQFFVQTAAAGSVPIVALRPTTDLDELDREDAEDLVASLEGIAKPTGARFWLSFAPGMNTSWVAWGQRPAEYRAAFATVADVVHDRLPEAGMLWSPFWGGDYPFGATAGALSAELDTNSDGLFDGADDPYTPYYPGDERVDAVGLALYQDTTGGGEPANAVPQTDEFVSRLTGADGTAPDFYGSFVSAQRPLIIETGAFYSPAAGGADELEIKRTWWRQIDAAVHSPALPELKAVVWRDTSTTRGAVGETVIDWSISLGSPDVRRAFMSDLASSDLVLGPVREPVASTSADVDQAGARWDGPGGWAVAAGAVALIGLLVAFALRRRGGGALHYEGASSRDERIDLLRGLAIVFVVINHVGLVSLFQNVTQEFFGIVSGAELFVLLSGAVLGIVYRPKLVSGGIGEVVVRTGQRAWKLYYTALAVVVLVFFLSLVPFLNGATVTTFTDQGTGAAGQGAAGRVYDLYATADQLLQYPVNPQSVVDFLLLRMGPWQFNVMGLYVVLLVLSPLVLWALGRRWWPWVLGASLALYTIGLVWHVRLLPSQFEDSFPLLVWQCLFVVGMTAGFYRREIVAWFATRRGRVALCVVIALAAALMVLSWNNPYTSSPLDVRLALVPDNAFRELYGALFERTYLEPGRLVNVFVLVVALYALLSAYWRPIERAVGWLLIPLGQATLYVFIMHVFFALIAGSIPLLREGHVWINTVANLIIVLTLWVMVKTRFLFRVVPR